MTEPLGVWTAQADRTAVMVKAKISVFIIILWVLDALIVLQGHTTRCYQSRANTVRFPQAPISCSERSVARHKHGLYVIIADLLPL